MSEVGLDYFALGGGGVLLVKISGLGEDKIREEKCGAASIGLVAWWTFDDEGVSDTREGRYLLEAPLESGSLVSFSGTALLWVFT